MPRWPRFVVVARDIAVAVETDEGSRIAADPSAEMQIDRQTGFLIFRLTMIVYYFAQDCT